MYLNMIYSTLQTPVLFVECGIHTTYVMHIIITRHLEKYYLFYTRRRTT